MASNDETVARESIVSILRRQRRDGWMATWDVLQHEEPVLAAYALAAADLLVDKLRRCGLNERAAEYIHREMMTAQITCIESMRAGIRELWKDFLPDEQREE